MAQKPGALEITAVCRRGLHDSCSGTILEFVGDEQVIRRPCQCAAAGCHGDPDQSFRRAVARGEYPGVRTPRWAG